MLFITVRDASCLINSWIRADWLVWRTGGLEGWEIIWKITRLKTSVNILWSLSSLNPQDHLQVLEESNMTSLQDSGRNSPVDRTKSGFTSSGEFTTSSGNQNKPRTNQSSWFLLNKKQPAQLWRVPLMSTRLNRETYSFSSLTHSQFSSCVSLRAEFEFYCSPHSLNQISWYNSPEADWSFNPH